MSKPGRKPNKIPQTGVSLSIRLDLGPGIRIGPGKVALLEQIDRTGSISGAGRALTMSYRRAWDLVEELNAAMGVAVVETAAGGTHGGGTKLTPIGQEIVQQYRHLEAELTEAARHRLDRLVALCKPPTEADQGRATTGT